MILKNYNPEKYWDEVAKQIDSRHDLKLIAGDDEPYYRYKRKKLLELFDKISYTNKKVLEVGSGPGGNLDYLSTRGAIEIAGTDISQNMVDLSHKLLSIKNIKVKKTDGRTLPYANKSFNLVFTATVLQHNTDELNLKALISEICRVSGSEVFIFERIENKIMGHESNIGRPIEYYSSLFMTHGFQLQEVKFLNIQVSYLVCGTIRKIFNPRKRKEGEPLTKLSIFLENILLPLTSILDKIITSKRDLGMLYFKT